MKKWLLFTLLCMGTFSFAKANQVIDQDTTMADFVGTYQFPDGSPVAEITVAINDSTLTMTSSVGSSVLEKKDTDVYSIIQFNGIARFNRDANKKVIGVSIEAMGYQLEGTKKGGIPMAISHPIFSQLADWVLIEKTK